MKQSFCDTGTLRRQKLPLPVPILPQDIYIKIQRLAVGTCGQKNVKRKITESLSLSVVTVTVNNVFLNVFEK